MMELSFSAASPCGGQQTFQRTSGVLNYLVEFCAVSVFGTDLTDEIDMQKGRKRPFYIVFKSTMRF